MLLGKKNLNQDVFYISEIGNNHNGSLDRAISMIDKSINFGADCVKFQMRSMNNLYRKISKKNKEDLGTEYIVDLLGKYELSNSDHKKIINYCKKKKINYLCSPWDIESLKFLENYNLEAYKLASADLSNLPLINAVLKTKKLILLSTGMSTEKEINFISKYLLKKNAKFILLHCNSTYPAPFFDINLRFLNKLKKLSNYVGYSGHERGIAVSIGSIALGACVIERHFTLDKNMEGPDHVASLDEKEFRQMILYGNELKQSLGLSDNRVLSQGEMINRENLGKSLVARKNIKKGTLIKRNHIDIKSPGRGLSPMFLENLVNKRSNRHILKGDFYYTSDLKSKRIMKHNLSFNIKAEWGIPVRFHDFEKFQSLLNANIWEFHLSYNDLNLNPSKFLSQKNSKFCVHAPELFANSNLLDLSSPNKNYLKLSIDNIKKVIEITLQLKKYFPQTKKPLIIANVGGYSTNGNISISEKLDRYEILIDSLNSLKDSQYEIIPQNMAPFPWHFGGQRYQNLFVLPEEIHHYAKKYGIRFCIDTSHAILTCNFYKLKLSKYLDMVVNYCPHFHIADASGFNGEGLQIGTGDGNFSEIMKIINQKKKTYSFIPEIWQGHKDNGSEFIIALKKLSKLC